MKGLLSFVIDIVSTPALLVAFIAILGNILQKKDIASIVKGGIKTFVGFLVVTAGAGIIENSLAPFGEMFKIAFNMKGVVPNNEAIVALALEKFGTYTALIMLTGMAFNLLIARFTKFKYIYLTGHATLYMSCMVAVILSINNMKVIPLIIFGGLAVGLINTISPAICQPFTKKITNNNTVALGHTGGLGYALSGCIGQMIGNKEKSTEDIHFPKGLAFLRDSTVSITITMSVVYIIVALFAGNDYITKNLSNGTNYIIYSLQQAGLFAAGIFIILAGVRLILAEIVPAFKGISEKLVPNSIPALDCPIVFPYAPNAVLIGFLTSFLGGIVSLIIMILTGTTVIIPGVVPHFFCGATAGIYGNATGGVRGAVAGSFVHGILISFMPLLLLPVMGGLGLQGSTFSDTDYSVTGIILSQLANISGQAGIIIGILILLSVLLMLTKISKRKKETSMAE
ncbi:PTS ascorbate transporter subunit IIC [Melissococcus plutonius]|uniref:Ascorbate-specific PTS system EIIC component n=1 Tax=Melissococcus plutonius TaxID=33970 RepID=A0A2Z5Y465_9ENTE|nr:PTS ascorbate transporter subunit IIC [Melissococcus plutonius]BAL62755.1 putative transport protein SgaT [Melissococcus plutonius DAT561]MCV2498674.1 PTS ascorbate transporter subunit IIC [Melissococcus plutonius]MCV2500985.1 PTS ascorbate transporter subunit IIC [Melissococcus plutonius]MCV2504658.1 PTS ascorbate transporter subunit IIC [Melissococcus plutonius]MCV2507118.1 PTS ascorbate transporter subunit IIC [Melissococcus plutonius]